MYIKGAVIILFAAFITGCTGQEQASEKNEAPPSIAEQKKEEVVSLEYSPVPVTEIKEGLPSTNMKKVKTVDLYVSGRKVVVELYRGPESDDSQLIFAFLQDNGRTFELGLASSYDMEGLDRLESVDVTGDGQHELLISGGVGATYVEMKVFSYDSQSEHWLNILTMGSPKLADIDRDGKNELIAISMGSLPPYVWIYRWNNNHFEQADVAKELGYVYARLVEENGETIIHSGTNDILSTYRYKDGKLIKISNSE